MAGTAAADTAPATIVTAPNGADDKRWKDFYKTKFIMNNYFAYYRMGYLGQDKPWILAVEDPNYALYRNPKQFQRIQGDWENIYRTRIKQTQLQHRQKWIRQRRKIMSVGPRPGDDEQSELMRDKADDALDVLFDNGDLDFALDRVLGFGGNGLAALCHVNDDRRRYQTKFVLKVDLHGRPYMRREKRYMMAMKRARHVAQMLLLTEVMPDATDQQEKLVGDDDSLQMLEYMKNGDLHGLICKTVSTDTRCTNEHLWKIFCCLIKGCVAMQYPPRRLIDRNGGTVYRSPIGSTLIEILPPPDLRESSYDLVHFDLDPRNVLIGDYDYVEHRTTTGVPVCKIADPGLAYRTTDYEMHEPTNVQSMRRHGKWNNLLPEQFHKEWEFVDILPELQTPRPKVAGQYGPASNVFHIAMCMHSMITQYDPIYPPLAIGPIGNTGSQKLPDGFPRFTNCNGQDVRDFWTHGFGLVKEWKDNDLNGDLTILLMRCLADQPADRPTLDELMDWADRVLETSDEKPAEYPGWFDKLNLAAAATKSTGGTNGPANSYGFTPFAGLEPYAGMNRRSDVLYADGHEIARGWASRETEFPPRNLGRRWSPPPGNPSGNRGFVFPGYNWRARNAFDFPLRQRTLRNAPQIPDQSSSAADVPKFYGPDDVSAVVRKSWSGGDAGGAAEATPADAGREDSTPLLKPPSGSSVASVTANMNNWLGFRKATAVATATSGSESPDPGADGGAALWPEQSAEGAGHTGAQRPTETNLERQRSSTPIEHSRNESDRGRSGGYFEALEALGLDPSQYEEPDDEADESMPDASTGSSPDLGPIRAAFRRLMSWSPEPAPGGQEATGGEDRGSAASDLGYTAIDDNMPRSDGGLYPDTSYVVSGDVNPVLSRRRRPHDSDGAGERAARSPVASEDTTSPVRPSRRRHPFYDDAATTTETASPSRSGGQYRTSSGSDGHGQGHGSRTGLKRAAPAADPAERPAKRPKGPRPAPPRPSPLSRARTLAPPPPPPHAMPPPEEEEDEDEPPQQPQTPASTEEPVQYIPGPQGSLAMGFVSTGMPNVPVAQPGEARCTETVIGAAPFAVPDTAAPAAPLPFYIPRQGAAVPTGYLMAGWSSLAGLMRMTYFYDPDSRSGRTVWDMLRRAHADAGLADPGPTPSSSSESQRSSGSQWSVD